ncbi:hypothetical protein SAMN02910451_00178 [Butyrivibrio hungatei]|uniref:Uncharacterized protein n=1 Tax=Butyrivibrio hungatei TaxID=185008 RepID=A0A1G5AEE9_9FIRM|nr:hypothetical protein SAMN02910451_00178 [Butyrivibrio hungatei]
MWTSTIDDNAVHGLFHEYCLIVILPVHLMSTTGLCIAKNELNNGNLTVIQLINYLRIFNVRI